MIEAAKGNKKQNKHSEQNTDEAKGSRSLKMPKEAGASKWESGDTRANEISSRLRKPKEAGDRRSKRE